MISKIESFIFKNKVFILCAFVFVTLILGGFASQLKIDAGFKKQIPLGHPYMKTFLDHEQEFGGANRLLVAVRSKNGDIFKPKVLQRIKEVTDAVFVLPGIDRSTVRSIFTPNVRFVEIVEGGFSGGNVVPADFQYTELGAEQVRENSLKANIVGRLISNDFSAAIVSAQLVENDPQTGDKLDYLKVSEILETKIRDEYSDQLVDIHIIGFAKAMGDVADGASSVLAFFLVAFIVSALLVFVFTHSWLLTLLPLVCSVVSVVWGLGLFTALGYGLDPMSILTPFLIFAIAVSHGVQIVNAVGAGVIQGNSTEHSARRAFRRLLVPGSVALASDCVGFLSILLIDIGIIQELAISASLGVFAIILTNLVLLPILVSYVRLGSRFKSQAKSGAIWKEWLWRKLSLFATRKVANISLLFAVLIGSYAYFEAQDVAIGDMHEGVPELRSDSRYNNDTRFITNSFSIGVDVINVIVETSPDACVDYEVMSQIDDFEWFAAGLPGVQSTLSLARLARVINSGWNEGNPKWRILPKNQQTLVQAISPVETSTGLLNRDCSVMPVMLFTEDHKASTIEGITSSIETYISEKPSDKLQFRLATGNVGVMAATNEVVEDAQSEILIYIYIAVILLCLLAFRSIQATLCVVLPLSLVSMLSYALMSQLEIGLKISTLPVAALGVGIGVDYGIYIYSRLRSIMKLGVSLQDAYLETLRVTGNAVLVTGLTLAISVSTWVLSSLKFQADMGLLLSFMFLANMVAAIVLLPALAYFFHEYTAGRSK